MNALQSCFGVNILAPAGATPKQLRTWAAVTRSWAGQTNDRDMAAEMRRLADELDDLARLKALALDEKTS
jgi:hypothetical protein